MDFACDMMGMNWLWWSALIIGMIALFFIPDKEKKGESAWDVLNKKFAEGALSVEEYEQRRAVLQQNKVKK